MGVTPGAAAAAAAARPKLVGSSRCLALLLLLLSLLLLPLLLLLPFLKQRSWATPGAVAAAAAGLCFLITVVNAMVGTVAIGRDLPSKLVDDSSNKPRWAVALPLLLRLLLLCCRRLGRCSNSCTL